MEVRRTKTVGQLSILPFISLATSCAVWAVYGVMLGDMTILIPNISGIAFGLWYPSVYHRYAPPTARLAPLYAGAGAIALAACVAPFALAPAAAASTVGLAGCALAVFMMASPLAVLRTDIRDRSTAALPFLPSLATFCSAASWFAYGLVVADNPMIYGPNVLGLAAAVVQLALFAIYPSKPRASA